MNASKEYIFARKTKSILQQDPELKALMHPTLYDDGSQTSNIILAAQSPQGVITITPGAAAPAYQRDPGGLLFAFDVEFAVTVWTLDEMTLIPAALSSAAEYRSALVERCLAAIKTAWARDTSIHFSMPEIRSIDDFLIEKKDIPSLAARSITLAIRINH